MRLKKGLCLIMIFMILLTSCTAKEADGDSTYTPPKAESVTVTDSSGRTVTTSADDASIVSVGYNATSLLIAVGAKGRIVAAEKQSEVLPLLTRAYPKLADLPAVTDSEGNADTEKIKQLRPALVILSSEYSQCLPELEAAGLTVATVSFDTFEQIKASITLVGELSNSREGADKLLSFYSSALTRIRTLTLAENTVSVTVQGNDPILTELIAYMNCTASDSGSFTVARKSDGIPGSIFTPNSVEPWDTPSVAAVLGLYWYTNRLFPEVFSADEISQKAINYYADFYGVTYTADELGL